MDTDKIETKPPTPWIPEKDTMVRMVIGKLGEETAELNKICCRILIQGLVEDDPSTGKCNIVALREEIADVLANIDVTINKLQLDTRLIADRRERKYDYLTAWGDLVL